MRNNKTFGNDGLSKEFDVLCFILRILKFLGRYKKCFHKFLEASENRRQPKYIAKTSCYKTFRKKTELKDT